MDWKSKKIGAILEQALIEDHATKDLTTQLTIDPELRASATLIAKESFIISGLGCIPRFLDIFARLDEEKKTSRRFEVVSHPEIFDGVRVKKGQALAVVRHNARVLLACERVILNLMQRMSGIATSTRQYVDAVAGTNVKILDTRKTVPGLRVLDKYAVQCGGGVNHRLDLSDGILIKNNHISLGGGVTEVLRKALADKHTKQRIEIEVRDFKELDEALAGGAGAILLDNMAPGDVKKAVKTIRNAAKQRGEEIPIEASGGIVLKNIRDYAVAGVDFISVGALTHSPAAVDISMRITAEIY